MPTFSGSELGRWSGGVWDGAPPPALAGVSTDTRALRPGSLYVALRGDRFDGHAFVAAALRQGAAAAAVQRDWAADGAAGPLLRVADPRRALGAMAAGYRAKIDPEIVAVTGSSGKSTVKDMAAQMLATTQPTARTQGNWNNDIGLPLSLLAMAPDTRIGVFELGTNHPGEIRALAELARPAWAVITNVGIAHTAFFGSARGVADEKGSLLASLPSRGVAVLDPGGAFFDVLRAYAPGRVVTVALHGRADYVGEARDAATGEVLVVERASGETARLRPPLPGAHQAMNLLQSVAVARGHGVGWASIRDALAAYRALPMRWEEREVAGRRIVNDAYNANPVSMAAALATLAERAGAGRKWLVLGGMLELGACEADEHRRIGMNVGGGTWAGLVTVGELGERIAEGAAAAGMAAERICRCRDNAAAAAAVAARAEAGDTVLFKASRRMRFEEIVAEVTEHWRR